MVCVYPCVSVCILCFTSQPLTLILILTLTLIHVGCFTLCCFPRLCYKPISVTLFSPGVHITNTAHRTVCGNACGGGGVEWGGGGYGCCRRQGEKTRFKETMTEREREREGRRRRGGEERRRGRRGEEERQEERERKRRKRDIGHPPLVCDTTLCIIQRTKTTIHTPTLTHLFPLFLPPLSSSFLLFPPLSSSSSSFLLPPLPRKE